MRTWSDYQAQQWKYLFEITHAIAARLDLESVLDQALRHAVDLVNGVAGLIALRGSGESFQFVARYGIEERLLPRFEPLLTRIPLTIERDQTPRWRFPELELRFAGVIDEATLRFQHVMAIPLITSEQLLGIIYVFRMPRMAAFSNLDEDALSGFADQVAIAVEHAWLYQAATGRAQELDTIIEASAHGILIANREGKISRINRALERLTGWSRDEAGEQDYRSVLQITDERDNPKPLDAFSDEIKQPSAADGLLKRRDGSRGPYVHVSLAPLYDSSRRLISIIGNVVDLTTFREADQLKTAFLAGISHDLKTPLALIRGYAETLRRTDVTWDAHTVDESLAIIQDEAEYLTNLVNALLDAAQIERGRLPLQLSETRVDEIARKMIERFQSLQEGHQWATEFPAEFPPVKADGERIREVLQNLLSNAMKYSPRGTLITVGGWVEAERVGVLVRDQGPGMSLEEQAHLFERFTRGRGRAAQRTQGAGLGLYLCRAIVEQHGGKIWAENLERGAAFYFTLPRQNE
jgi:PAS domain S-box-containing protein